MCNLSCSFCIGNSRAPRFMSAAEFSHVLRQIHPFAQHVYLHVLGEPLMHPLLDEFLHAVKSEGLTANLTTNGTLLAERQPLLLKAKALRKVSVSLHSMEFESEELKKRYLREVTTFALAAAESGIICELRMWNVGEDRTNNSEMLENVCRRLNLSGTSIEESKEHFRLSGNATLAPRLYFGEAERFEWPSMKAPHTDRPIFCYALRSQAAVLCDGTVVPCCLDSCGDIALGNIFTTSFAEILESARAKALYDGFSHRQPSEELCRRCGYATRF